MAKLEDTSVLADFDKSLNEVKAAQHASVAVLKAAVADLSFFGGVLRVFSMVWRND